MFNTPNGSWGIVQTQPISAIISDSGAPRMNLSNRTQLNARRVEFFVLVL